jgi:hypothetical protein
MSSRALTADPKQSFSRRSVIAPQLSGLADSDAPARPLAASRGAAIFCVVFGSALSLVVSGYQFGRGNQTCYLLDGMRTFQPWLLRRDWFMTQTLQYHAVFSRFIEGLMYLHVLEPGLLIGYLALIVLWQAGWYRIARALGASNLAYLASVLFYFISSAGISLGVYQFMQDGCFLPSNVANVAMLWGIFFWIVARPAAAGACLGIAGLVHVNFAVAGIMVWPALVAWLCVDAWRNGQPILEPLARRSIIVGSILTLAPCASTVIFCALSVLRQPPGLSLADFVAVYVRFRHTHHFDPLAWNSALWIGFLWPIPLAIWSASRSIRTHGSDAIAANIYRDRIRQAVRVFLIVCAMLLTAFVFAGIWYVSETLIQLCLFRFSIYVKLLSCLGAAYLLCDSGILRRKLMLGLLTCVPLVVLLVTAVLVVKGRLTPIADLNPLVLTALAHLPAMGLMALLCALPLVYALATPRGPRRALGPFLASIGLVAIVAAAPAVGALGLGMTPEPDDADYRQVCVWAADPAHTPLDAIFLVPPQETDFRLYGQRAIIVNFKHIPQLSHEIRQWRDRLADVLGTKNFAQFPRDYPLTLAAIGRAYESRPTSDLLAVAKKYDARFIVVAHDLGSDHASQIVFHPQGNRYFVYDLTR